MSTKDNNNLTKQLNEGFKRTIYWNQYVSQPFPETPHKKAGVTRFALDAAFQGVNKLFVLAFEDTRADEAADAPAPRNLVANRVIRDSYRKYFVPHVDITSYNMLIDGRNFYDQPINDSIRKHDEIRKIVTVKGDNYATGCLLDYDYFKKNYQLMMICWGAHIRSSGFWTKLRPRGLSIGPFELENPWDRPRVTVVGFTFPLFHF